jgi:hypothetical protein
MIYPAFPPFCLIISLSKGKNKFRPDPDVNITSILKDIGLGLSERVIRDAFARFNISDLSPLSCPNTSRQETNN